MLLAVTWLLASTQHVEEASIWLSSHESEVRYHRRPTGWGDWHDMCAVHRPSRPPNSTGVVQVSVMLATSAEASGVRIWETETGRLRAASNDSLVDQQSITCMRPTVKPNRNAEWMLIYYVIDKFWNVHSRIQISNLYIIIIYRPYKRSSSFHRFCLT